ncbi:hypothetical protein [Nostoc sp.]
MGIAASLSYTFSLQRYLTTSRGAMSRRAARPCRGDRILSKKCDRLLN